MRNQFSYPVKLKKQKKGYVVNFPDFPEAITQGETVEHALTEALDCLEEAIANRVEMKLPLPAASRAKRSHRLVTLSTTFAAKVALYLAVREANVSNTALAKRLHCDEKEVRRLLDPHYSSKFPRIEEALQVLGKKIRIEITSL